MKTQRLTLPLALLSTGSPEKQAKPKDSEKSVTIAAKDALFGSDKVFQSKPGWWARRNMIVLTVEDSTDPEHVKYIKTNKEGLKNFLGIKSDKEFNKAYEEAGKDYSLMIMAKSYGAVSYLMKMAKGSPSDQNKAEAHYQLGLLYANKAALGQGRKHFKSKAVEHFIQSSTMMDPKAPDAKGLIDHLKIAAKEGNVDALKALGKFYERSGNMKQAFQWLKKAADQGEVECQVKVGEMYEKGFGVNADPSEAVKYYKKAVDKNNPHAINNLARCLANGSHGITQNITSAIRLYERNVSSNDKACKFEALYQLAQIHSNEVPEGSPYENIPPEHIDSLFKAAEYCIHAAALFNSADENLQTAMAHNNKNFKEDMASYMREIISLLQRCNPPEPKFENQCKVLDYCLSLESSGRDIGGTGMGTIDQNFLNTCDINDIVQILKQNKFPKIHSILQEKLKDRMQLAYEGFDKALARAKSSMNLVYDSDVYKKMWGDSIKLAPFENNLKEFPKTAEQEREKATLKSWSFPADLDLIEKCATSIKQMTEELEKNYKVAYLLQLYYPTK